MDVCFATLRANRQKPHGGLKREIGIGRQVEQDEL